MKRIKARKIIRAKLLENGLTLKEFSQKYNFKLSTVHRVLYRLASEQKIRGQLSVRIVEKLKEFYEDF
jgi:predicted transcriptional regulator